VIMEITASRKRSQLKIRARRTRAGIRRGSRPRFSVFRSGRHIYAQIIDDALGHTMVSVHDIVGGKGGAKKKQHLTPMAAAAVVGETIAKKAAEKDISSVIFDRGGYKYHGRVKALAEAARKAGLRF